MRQWVLKVVPMVLLCLISQLHAQLLVLCNIMGYTKIVNDRIVVTGWRVVTSEINYPMTCK